MAIYRGSGGSGDAVNDSSSEAVITVQARDAALAAQAAAEVARNAAQTAETNAETAETNAETAETNAETAQAAAASSASAASSSASAASTSASNASTSASAASASASTAGTQATNASNSATAAGTSATNAAASASAASTSATNASNSASAASTSATNASNSASAASTSATNAANSATLAASYTPSQTGNSGKFLTTNGSNTSWGNALNAVTIGATTPATGAFTTLSASGTFSANGGATLGDASGDALTINSSAVSIPNGLNFDSNTLVIDSTNNRVGVGTASAVSTLDVTVSSATPYSATASGTAFRVANIDASTATNFSSMQLVTDGNGRGIVNLNALNNASASSADFSIQTRHNGTLGERLRISSTGNLGLGVTPSAWNSGYKAIEVGGGGNALVSASGTDTRLYQNAYFSSSANTYVRTATATLFNMSSSGQFQWFNAPSGTAGNAITFTQAMTLDASGNLGIGTTSPNARLSVRTTGAQVDVSSSATSVTFEAIDRSATTNPVDTLYYTRNGTFLWYNSSYSERMRLDSSGNVGLGVTPSAWGSLGTSRAIQLTKGALSSLSGGPNDYIAVSSNSYADTSSDPASAVWKYVATGTATLYEGGRSGQHRFYTAASGTAGNAITFTQAMTLNSSGNLGIGTTSPNASAILDAQSTTKGVRMPNMTTTQKNAISSPAAGLMVFDTTLAKLCVYSGSAWQTITST